MHCPLQFYLARASSLQAQSDSVNHAQVSKYQLALQMQADLALPVPKQMSAVIVMQSSLCCA